MMCDAEHIWRFSLAGTLVPVDSPCKPDLGFDVSMSARTLSRPCLSASSAYFFPTLISSDNRTDAGTASLGLQFRAGAEEPWAHLPALR